MGDLQGAFNILLDLYSHWRRKHILEGCEYVAMPLGAITKVAYAYDISGNTLMNDIPLMNAVFNKCGREVHMHFDIKEECGDEYFNTARTFHYRVVSTYLFSKKDDTGLTDIMHI